MVVTFPCKVPENTPVAANYTWQEQLEMVMRMQKEWSDNSVSCTVYYKKEDLEDIKQFLEHNFSENLKTVSFLLYQGHGFKQAPYETISKEVYLENISKVKIIKDVDVNETTFEIMDCDNGSCPIK